MRLFIAIQWKGAALDALRAAQDALRHSGVQGRFAPPQNLHLTLAFLGETVCGEAAAQALRAVDVPSFRLCLAGVDRFPTSSGATVIARFAPCAQLEALHKQLSGALARAGFSLEARSFTPHVTLVRRASAVTPHPLPPVLLPVEELVLLQSILRPEGPRYTRLALHRLEKGEYL